MSDPAPTPTSSKPKNKVKTSKVKSKTSTASAAVRKAVAPPITDATRLRVNFEVRGKVQGVHFRKVKD